MTDDGHDTGNEAYVAVARHARPLIIHQTKMDCDPVMSLTQRAGEVPDEAEEVVHKSFYSDHNLHVSDENSEYESSSGEPYMEEVNIEL